MVNEQEKSCKYCKENKALYWHNDDEGGNDWIKEVYLELDGHLAVSSKGDTLSYFQEFPDSNVNAQVKINYCPMCGGKLEESK